MTVDTVYRIHAGRMTIRTTDAETARIHAADGDRVSAITTAE
jgi:hypothetical protein